MQWQAGAGRWATWAGLGALALVFVGIAAPSSDAATYTGTLWHDRDADGVLDPGEPGLADVPVRLLRGDYTFLRGTVTDANGTYTLTTTADGEASVVEVVSGWFRSGCVYGASDVCEASRGNDFRVDNERVLVGADGVPPDGTLTADAGFVPDWGDPDTSYPGPTGAFNAVDVALRASGMLHACADPEARVCGLGQVVRTSVQAFNQGTQPLRDVEVTLSFDPSTGPAPGEPLLTLRDAPPGVRLVVVEPYLASSNRAIVRLAGVLPPASAVTFEAPLQAVRGPFSPARVLTSPGDPWSKEFYAEVSAIGDQARDVDATNDTDPANDALLGHQVNAPADRDEDDHDDVGFHVAGYDLALRAVPTMPANDAPGPTTVAFTVLNQGNLPVAAVEVSAYVPTGARVTGSTGWTERGGGRWSTTLAPTIAPGASGSVAIDVVAPVAGGVVAGEVAAFARPTFPAIPARDLDSTPDTIPDNDHTVDDAVLGEGGDEDDHDVAMLAGAAAPGGPGAPGAPGAPGSAGAPGAAGAAAPEAYGGCRSGARSDLALQIVRVRRVPVRPRGIVTLWLRVANQGRVAAHDVRVSQYLKATDALTMPAARNGRWVRASATRVERRIPILSAGRRVTVVLRLRARPATAGRVLRSIAEITSAKDQCGTPLGDVDSSLDARPLNDLAPREDAARGGRPGEDDHDWVWLRVRR